MTSSNRTFYVMALIVLVVTAAVYMPVFQAGFTNWDDPEYVVRNEAIQGLSWPHIKMMFTDIVVKNWHPLTLLSYAIEHHFFGLNPAVFHATNVVLHVLNTFLVMVLARRLSGKLLPAAIAGLLFGIHPLHVESVAWVSERKDVLFCFFYLAGLIAYHNYLRGKRASMLFCVWVLFLLSLLSKVTAVSFPVVLVLLDAFHRRRLWVKALLEKVPFFALSVVFGCITLFTHKDQFTTRAEVGDAYSVLERGLFLSYGYLQYIWKIIWPLNLSAVYPFPEREGGMLPAEFYAAPFVLLGFAALCVWAGRRSRTVSFGILFFTATIFLNLPFSVIGEAIIADRYVYLPCFGIFFMAGAGAQHLLSSALFAKKGMKYVFAGGLAIAACVFAGLSYSRAHVWQDSVALWSDVIEKYPGLGLAYLNRGNVYLKRGEHLKAVSDYSKILNQREDFLVRDALSNRAHAFLLMGRYDRAVEDFSKVIALNPRSVVALNQRGQLFLKQKKYPEALSDFNTILEIHPRYEKAYNNRGEVFLKLERYPYAIQDFQKAVELNPGYADAHRNLGTAYLQTDRFSEAVDALTKSIQLNPGDVKAVYNRGVANLSRQRYDAAIEDFDTILRLDSGLGFVLFSRSRAYAFKEDYDKAMLDALKARSAGYPVPEEYFGYLAASRKRAEDPKR